MSNQHTTDEIFSPIGPPTGEEQAIRFLDIHIYEQASEPEEPLSVENKIEPESAPRDESTQEYTKPVRSHQKQRRYIIALCVSIVCLSVVSALVLVSLLPLFTPDATITIVPRTQPIHLSTNVLVTTGHATGTQLPGRVLVAITMSQAQTIPTTGKGHQEARAAQGSITFYNAATSPQTVAAGTLLTGADGEQVVTEQDAPIPAAQYPTFGQTSVPSQAVLAGPTGNIVAGDIYGPCCRLNVSAVSSTFHGGQAAREYPMVTLQDLRGVATDMKTSLGQSVQATLQTEVRSDETLIVPPACQGQVAADHQPGQEARQVTITMRETCTGATYNTQAFHSLVTQIMVQEAYRRLGEGYTTQGAVQTSITQVTRKGNGPIVVLQVTCAAMWGYQFTPQQQAQIKQQIAGKSKAQAITTVLHIPGVQTVSIESASVPTSVSHIHIVFVAMQ